MSSSLKRMKSELCEDDSIETDEEYDDDGESEPKRQRKASPAASTPSAVSKSKSGKSPSNRSATISAMQEGDSWAYMFYKLMVYRAIHGDFNVPVKSAEHKRLCEWIKEQRRQYKLHQEADPGAKLTQEQILVLESVQFPLTTRGDDHWKRNFENLKKFKEDHGHILVPRLCEVQGLGDWVTDQRRQLKALKQGKPSLLTADRKKLLDDLGFVWEVRNRPEWTDRFQQLVEYKQKFGTTCVPQFYAENRGLGKWVAKQREQFKLKRQGKHSFLTADREEQLVQIGFVWSVKGNTIDDDDDLHFSEEAAAVAPSPVVDNGKSTPFPSRLTNLNNNNNNPLDFRLNNNALRLPLPTSYKLASAGVRTGFSTNLSSSSVSSNNYNDDNVL